MEQSLTQFLPVLLSGAWITAKITIIAIPLATAIAFVSALMRLSDCRPVRYCGVSYIEFFRGSSQLVQMFWLFFVLPYFGIRLSPFTVGWLVMGLNIGAYGAEVVRGAIQAVPPGQYEAATSINMGKWQAMRRVIIPQAIPNMIPPMGNLYIELLKDTSLLSLITITELSFQAHQLNNRTFQTAEIFGLTLLIYLAMALVLTVFMRFLERYAGRGLMRGGA